MAGKICIVSTPIGNFEDITLNALNALRGADFILCEDTRKTDTLLKHYNISGKKLLIYNEFTTEKELEHYINLATEKIVCVVSDAGTPLICDPGHAVIAKAHKNSIAIEICGGVCSLILGATLCGVNIQNMLFLGFFNGKNAIINPQEKLTYSYFVAPHDTLRLLKSLELFEDFYASINIAKDLTKQYQQYFTFNLSDAITHFQTNESRGEFVFFITFKQKTVQNLEKIIVKVLDELPNWRTLGKKDLANFLHKNCQNLQAFTPKAIYNFLIK